VKRKLDETIPNLSSPIPSPDVNAPSPERDADLQLPDENNVPLVLITINNTFPLHLSSIFCNRTYLAVV